MREASDKLSGREKWALAGLVIGAGLLALGFLIGRHLGAF